MAREGAAVVIADLNEANAGGVTREIEHLGGKASAVYTDISNEESVGKTMGSDFYKLTISIHL